MTQELKDMIVKSDDTLSAYIKEIEVVNNGERIATLKVFDETSFALEIENGLLESEELEFIVKIHRIAHERYLSDIKEMLSSKELLEKANKHINKIGKDKATFMEGVIFGYGLGTGKC